LLIREKGANRSRFFRGQVDMYTWVDIGSSYLPSDIWAAFLYAQLETREEIQEKRRKIWEYYYQQLGAWADENSVRLPIIPAITFVGISPDFYRTSESSWHSQRSSLSTVIPVRHGAAVWRQG
jgi:dTDP-4-amino-4,6-dideoxygalactose transaminase